MPLSVLVLHHHQCAGPQVAPSLRRTTWSASCDDLVAQGIHKFFVTDDNFARNKDWEAIFDRLISLREKRWYPARPDDPSRYALSQDSTLH